VEKLCSINCSKTKICASTLRDRAFIALLARLDVRAGELRRLHLEDIEWTQGLVHIRQSKTGRGRTLSLPEDAGQLLVRYLREERPSTPYRQVFLSFASPRRPFGYCVTTSLVKNFLKKLDLDGPGRGVHSFRHYAGIAPVAGWRGHCCHRPLWLGHESIETTHGYVEADLDMKQRELEMLAPATASVSRFKAGDALLQFLSKL
jgi:integrase/recombinase XerC